MMAEDSDDLFSLNLVQEVHGFVDVFVDVISHIYQDSFINPAYRDKTR